MSGDAPSTIKTDGDGTNLLSGLETEEHPEQVDLSSSYTSFVVAARFEEHGYHHFSRAGYAPSTPLLISPVPLLLYLMSPCDIDRLSEPTGTHSFQTSIYFSKSLEQHSHKDFLPRPVEVRDSVNADRWLYHPREGASVTAREVIYVFLLQIRKQTTKSLDTLQYTPGFPPPVLYTDASLHRQIRLCICLLCLVCTYNRSL